MHSSKAIELSTLAAFSANGRHWAESASQELLPFADRPSPETIQAFECLVLYWFAIGDIDRARIHLGIISSSISPPDSPFLG